MNQYLSPLCMASEMFQSKPVDWIKDSVEIPKKLPSTTKVKMSKFKIFNML